MDAVADYPLLDPADWRVRIHRSFYVAAGLDWGFSRDANAMVIAARLEDGDVNGEHVYYLPWLEKHHGKEYSEFEDRVLEVNRSYRLYVVESECNGVGAGPTQNLQKKFLQAGDGGSVRKVWTDPRRKMSGMSMLKGRLQCGTLILPRHPELLSGLRALVFETLPSGMLQIAAPGTQHDDPAISLMQAVTCLNDWPMWDRRVFADFEFTTTARGTVFPVHPVPRRDYTGCYRAPEGEERAAEAGW